jgi:hypothetical protein
MFSSILMTNYRVVSDGAVQLVAIHQLGITDYSKVRRDHWYGQWITSGIVAMDCKYKAIVGIGKFHILDREGYCVFVAAGKHLSAKQWNETQASYSKGD